MSESKSYIFTRGKKDDGPFYSITITVTDQGHIIFSNLVRPKDVSNNIMDVFYSDAEKAVITYQNKYEDY